MEAGALLEHGRVTPGTPAAAHQGRHQEAGFINKDEPGLQARSVFFTRGQRFNAEVVSV